jgi:hypothetical protein
MRETRAGRPARRWKNALRNPAAFPPFAAEFSAISPYAASIQGFSA